ncbi:unnamed protein product [Adineta ricciae]|nr:unnamed protein product [Adineta ricciae]
MRFKRLKWCFSLLVLVVALIFVFINTSPSILYPSESTCGCRILNFTYEQIIKKSDFHFHNCRKSFVHHSKFHYEKHLLTVNCPLTHSLSITLSPNYITGRTRGNRTQTSVDQLIKRSPNAVQLHSRQADLNNLLKKIRTKDIIEVLILEDELFTVACDNQEQLFIQTIIKSEVESKLPRKRSNLPPVILLEFDSLSRLHFYRKLPETANFIWNNLSRLADRYTVLDYHRYHTLGRNTDPNIRVIFCASGKYGWGKNRAWLKTWWWRWCRKDYYIFNVFKRNGYVTSLAVNVCQDLILDYVGKSDDFHVDYESVTWACHKEYDLDGQWDDSFGPYGHNPRCIDGKYVHTYLLDYIKNFVEKHDRKPFPYIQFASFTEGHERTMEIVGLMDRELTRLLEYLTSSKLKQPPIIFLFGDHGLHYGPTFDQTIAGKMEARLPAFIPIIPNQYLTSSSKQVLIENQDHFVTHRDFYWTLFNIATNQSDKPLATDDIRRTSLFNRISTKRDCITEGIPKSLCACSDDGIHFNPELLLAKVD